MGEGALRCSLNLSPNVLDVSPMYSSSHSNLSHLNLYIIPLFFVIGSLSLGATNSSFNVLPLLKCTYNTAKELARILKPLVGLSEHHIQNTFDFVQQIKEVKLKKDESLVSYDVTALFTSVPIPPILKIIEEKLKEDKELSRRTNMLTQGTSPSSWSSV